MKFIHGWYGLMVRAGYSWAGGCGFKSPLNTFHLENRSPNYFGIDTIGTENVWENGGKKETEMFQPIAVRNRLTAPYAQKVLGNLKQCIPTDIPM